MISKTEHSDTNGSTKKTWTEPRVEIISEHIEGGVNSTFSEDIKTQLPGHAS